jgi:hypothetical protein
MPRLQLIQLPMYTRHAFSIGTMALKFVLKMFQDRPSMHSFAAAYIGILYDNTCNVCT